MFISVNNKIIIKFLVLFFASFLFFLLIEVISIKYLHFKFIEIFLLCSIIINITAYIFETQKQYYGHFILLLLFFISIFYIKIFNNLNISGSNLKFTIAFYTGITNFVLLLSCFLNKKYKFLSYVVQIVLLFPTLFIWQYFFISNSFVTVDTVLAIFQTNFGEAKDYMYTFMGIKQYAGLLFLLIISFFILRYNNKLKLKKINNITLVILLIVSISLNIFLVYRYKDNIVTKIVINTKDYLNEYSNFKKLVSERKISDINFNKSENINNGVYVLVIGESQNKKHMSAYGYNKKTSPWLDSMEKDKNFIKLENAFSCHTHTVPVLSYALTSNNQYNNLELSKIISVLDVAKAADIKTVWLSNQVHYGGVDTPVSVIADTAQQQKWINENFGNTDTDFYDIQLLEELNKITLNDNMLIVIHLMGSHVSYQDRYPSEFNIFKNEKTSIYDNSILYNDFVMENVFKKVKSLPNFKALIYFADHSEAIEQDLSHGADQFVPDMTYIPVYMYFSDSYIKDNPKIYKNLVEHKNNFFTNDLLFNLLMGVLNIKIQDVYEQNNDITSEYYNNDINRFQTLYGKKRIVDM